MVSFRLEMSGLTRDRLMSMVLSSCLLEKTISGLTEELLLQVNLSCYRTKPGWQ